jgi:predicted PurR-regulated permease PerM
MTTSAFWRNIFYLAALAVVVLFFWHAWSVIVPFFLGFVVAYLLSPFVQTFEARGFRRDRLVIIFYVIGMSALAGLSFWLLPKLFHELETAAKSVNSYAASLNSLVDQITIEIRVMLRRIIGHRADSFEIPFHANKAFEVLFAAVPNNLMNLLHLGFWAFIIPFSCFFALSQGPQWFDRLFDLTPSEHVESLLGLLAEINATLGGYVRGQLLDAMAVGTLTMVGLGMLGLDGAVLLGVLTGFLNVIPYMAPLVGGSLALLVGYFQGVPNSTLYGILFLYGGVRIIDDFVFMPFIVGRHVSLHPLVMLFAILAGVHVGGFFGLVFSVPIAAVIKVILSIVFHPRRDRFAFDKTVLS